MPTMHPAHGGRLVFERESLDHEATYSVCLLTPKEAWYGVSHICLENGEIRWGTWQPKEPPKWLLEAAHTFLRVEWSRRRGGEPQPWPQRITRWREERTQSQG